MNLIQPVGLYKPIPERIGRLNELAYNLWWSWHPEAQKLFSQVDEGLWELVYHNPVKLLNEVRRASLEAVAADPEYLKFRLPTLSAFDEYMASARTWYKEEHPTQKGTVAYFSAEFGLAQVAAYLLRWFRDTVGRSREGRFGPGCAEVFVGFLYPQGYFRQTIDGNGWQEAVYNKLDFDDEPAMPAVTPDGHRGCCGGRITGRVIYAKVYRIQVGRCPLFLMDTDIYPNAPADRELSARLYGGDQEVRIAQEIVLGIGGVRALRQLGIAPSAWHMNEGHSAFLVLELIRERVEAGDTFMHALHKFSDARYLQRIHP